MYEKYLSFWHTAARSRVFSLSQTVSCTISFTFIMKIQWRASTLWPFPAAQTLYTNTQPFFLFMYHILYLDFICMLTYSLFSRLSDVFTALFCAWRADLWAGFSQSLHYYTVHSEHVLVMKWSNSTNTRIWNIFNHLIVWVITVYLIKEYIYIYCMKNNFSLCVFV